MVTGYDPKNPLFARSTPIQWTPEQLAELKAQNAAADERRGGVSLAQSQGTSPGPSPGAVPYTAPAPTVTIENGVRTTSYNIQDLQLNAKVEAYTAARAQGKSEEEAENIGSTAGLNAGDAALRGVYTDYNATTSARSPGVGSDTDDNSNGINTLSGTNAGLNSSTQPSGGIKPQPNVLDNFASYTYNIGWYLLTLPQSQQVMTSSKIDTSQWSLLMQSGGAPASQQGSSQTGSAGLSIPSLANLAADTLTKGGTATRSTGGRNQFFPLDYYIDNLEIRAEITGSSQGTMAGISFQVTEPNGLTLLPNLNSAVRQAYKDTTLTARQAIYCLVIKFYGWDINGNLITDPSSSRGVPGAMPSGANAAVVRYYPFTLINLDFKLAGKQVEYSCKCASTAFKYATSTAFGSVPYNIELTGETVKQVLVGNGTTSTVPLDAKGKPIGSGREATNKDTPGTTDTTKDVNTPITNAEIQTLSVQATNNGNVAL
jgi:hypothetical protein